jgi:hypothetical protein
MVPDASVGTLRGRLRTTGLGQALTGRWGPTKPAPVPYLSP